MKRKPSWIKFKIPGGESYTKVKSIIEKNNLNTVCLEAGCPNVGECFGNGTATFLILGDICTRNCLYCSVTKGIPKKLSSDEDKKIVRAIKALNLNYSVITSVTRDDLLFGGAEIYAKIVQCLKKEVPKCKIELLIPDFKLSFEESMELIIASNPDVINHNIEVAGSYYKKLRPLGDYKLSLKLLEKVSKSNIVSKSGLMIGFGETRKEIRNTLKDLRSSGCKYLTVGQYLQSRKDGFEVEKYYTPDEFKEIEIEAIDLGFDKVFSAPLVRSSYHASEMQNNEKLD